MFWTFYIRRGKSLLLCDVYGLRLASQHHLVLKMMKTGLMQLKRTAELWNSGKVIFTGRSE